MNQKDWEIKWFSIPRDKWLEETGFFQEQFHNWKLKVLIVLLALVVLGVIGYIIK